MALSFPTIGRDPRRRLGPHLQPYRTGLRLDTGVEPDRLVKTHCCFCGQQCGIQLKVKDNQVIGFEPWVRLPVQPRHALPQGREALPAGRASRSAARRPTSAIRGAEADSAPIALRRGDRDGSPPRSSASRRRTARDAFGVLERREPDDREGVPDGQVRPRLPEDAGTSTTTAGSAWSAPARPTRRPSASTARANPWSDILEGRGRLDQRRQRRRVRADHHRLRLAGARERRRRSSSSIRASRRSRAPATSSCRSSRAATSPCSTASCT